MANAPQWAGLITDVDPHDNPGARIQDNCQSLSLGKLTGRKGVREVWLEDAVARGAPATDVTTLPNVLALSTLRTAHGDYLVYLNSDGELHSGRRPC